MKASKFFQSLQFRLIAIVTLIFLASNIVIVTVAMRLSTKSTNDSVDALLNAVAKSASEKIKAQEEKNFRMLNALALSDFLKDESLPLREKCAQLTKIAKVSDEYENIGFYDLDGNGFTADGRAINLKRAYIDNAAVGKTTITDPAVNPITNVLFQIYAAPVYDDNKKIIGCISLFFRHDSALYSLLANAFNINAVTVITHFDNNVVTVLICIQEDRTGFRLASGNTLLRHFQSVIGRIPEHMHKRIAYLVNHGTVKLCLFTAHIELHGLVKLLGDIADHSRELAHNALDGDHSYLHDRFVKVGGHALQIFYLLVHI